MPPTNLHACNVAFLIKNYPSSFNSNKRQSQPFPIKYVVSHVGCHADGTWVLGKNAYFTSNGTLITTNMYGLEISTKEKVSQNKLINVK